MMMSLMRSESAHEDCHLDVSELAKVFQALKFRIRSCGVSELSIAEETSAESSTGIRITVTCLKSRQQLVLQRDALECSCSQIDEDKGSWEVMATSGSRSSLVETACGLHPPLKADAALAVRRLMEHVGALAAGRVDPPTGAAVATPKWRERRSDGWHRLSLGAAEERPSAALVDFAARYRSLDTLIDKDDSVACADLPKPGALLKPASNSCFDAENRSVSDTQIAPSQSPCSPNAQKTPSAKGQVLSYLLAAQDNIAKAIAMNSSGSVTKSAETRSTKPSVSRIGGTRSCPKLDANPTMPPPKSSELPRSRVVRRPVSDASRLAMPAVTVTAPTTTKKIPTAAAKSKYAHVKSTIPKPSPRN